MLQTKAEIGGVDRQVRASILEMEEDVQIAARLSNACVVFALYGVDKDIADGLTERDCYSLVEICYSLLRATDAIKQRWDAMEKLTAPRDVVRS